jgi:hypothetical protein
VCGEKKTVQKAQLFTLYNNTNVLVSNLSDKKYNSNLDVSKSSVKNLKELTARSKIWEYR